MGLLIRWLVPRTSFSQPFGVRTVAVRRGELTGPRQLSALRAVEPLGTSADERHHHGTLQENHHVNEGGVEAVPDDGVDGNVRVVVKRALQPLPVAEEQEADDRESEEASDEGPGTTVRVDPSMSPQVGRRGNRSDPGGQPIGSGRVGAWGRLRGFGGGAQDRGPRRRRRCPDRPTSDQWRFRTPPRTLVLRVWRPARPRSRSVPSAMALPEALPALASGQVMKRSGLETSSVLELRVYPAIYKLWKRHTVVREVTP